MQEILTIQQASEYLNFSISRLRYEVFQKRIPYYKVGKSIRFRKSELAEWISGKKIGGENGDNQHKQ